MTYTQDGNRVTLEMTRPEYQQLLVILGAALSSAARIGDPRDREIAHAWLSFVNDLNNGNPHFTPYAIPEN